MLDDNKYQELTLHVANVWVSDFGLNKTRIDINVFDEMAGEERLLFTLNLPLDAALHALIAECACVRNIRDREAITKALGERCAEQFNEQWPEHPS